MERLIRHAHILATDLRYGARKLTKAPAFALVAVMVMGLGIGATTAVFSLVNAVLLRALPYGDPQRLVYIWTPNPHLEGTPREMSAFAADYYDWLRLSHSFTSMALFQQAMFNVMEPGQVTRLGGARVSGSFFQTLQVPPLMGRAIGPEDDRPGAARVAVISYAYWQSHLGGDPAVLGRSVQVDRQFYRIAGVMPRRFVYPHEGDFAYGLTGLRATDIWIPLAFTDKQKTDRETDPEDGNEIARLRPGVTLAQAQTEMSAIEAQLDPLYPAQFRGWQAYVQPFTESASGDAGPLLRLLLGAVALVLLIACTNVANLLAARAAGRSYEISVRFAMGAKRARLVRQMLTEALLLAAGGGAAGVLVGLAAMRVLVRLSPGILPRMDEVSLDTRVLLFTVSITVAAGIAFGLLPALAATGTNAMAGIRQGGRAVAGRSKHLLGGLIVTEVALAVMLLAGAGLLIRSYLNVLAVDTGFNSSTLTMKLTLDESYPSQEQRTAFFRTLIQRVREVPGVAAAGLVGAVPLSHHESITWLEVKGYPNRKGQMTDSRGADGGYFEAMGIRLLAGRYLHDGDAARKPLPMVVSRSFAAMYFPGQQAVGREIRTGGGADTPWSVVVGVVDDVRHSATEQQPKPTVYGPFDRDDAWQAALAIRAHLPPETAVAAVRSALRSLDPALAPEDVHTMLDRVSESNSRRRFQTLVLSAFAGFAVLLALVGIYGLMAYTVKNQTSEIGVRLALGAPRSRVLSMILRRGLGLVAAGLIVGLAASAALNRLVSSWLFGVTPADPLTLAAVPLLVLSTGFAACLIPACKATRIDPLEALRYE